MIAQRAGEGWFWDTPEWAAYLEAYERPHDPHFGDANLVIELRGELEMWRLIRKGHQAAITRAVKLLGVRQGEFAGYRELHRLANGDVRPSATFTVMERWIPDHAQVWVAYAGEVPAAAALFIHHEDGVYYASGPRNVAVTAPGAAHLLIWTAMRFYAAAGFAWLDMGPVPGADATDKERSIASFKKYFGATQRTWHGGYE